MIFNTRHIISTLAGVTFLALAMGSGDESKDEDAPDAPEDAGSSKVEINERADKGPDVDVAGDGDEDAPAAEDAPEEDDSGLKCTEIVDGKLGEMLDKVVDEYKDKTDLQKEDFEKEKKAEFAAGGYCGKVSGNVDKVTLDGWDMSGCEAPAGMDAYITLDEIDGKDWVGATIYAPASTIKEQFGAVNKGDNVTIDIYAYQISFDFHGAVCGVMK